MIQAWFVFIESNSTGTGELFALMARKRGLRPVILADNPARYRFLDHQHIDFIKTNTSDSRAIAEVAADLAQRAPIAGVYSSSEYFIEAAAELSRSLKLPGPDYNSIRNYRNKWRQRLALQAAGFALPKFHLVRVIEDTLNAVSSVGLPCILKPTLGTGSIGVRLCTTAAEAKQHAELLLQRHENERGIPVAAELLVEEYVHGPEFSVETFHGKAVGVTRKYTTPEPYFVERGHDFPADLPDVTAAVCRDTVSKALCALGLMWGPAHTELRYSEDRAVIMEINPRLAGGFIPKLVQLASGVDLIEATLAVAVGDGFDVMPCREDHASIRFLIPEKEGELVRIDGLEEISRMPCVVDTKPYFDSGHACRIQYDFRDRLGHVITLAATQYEAIEAVETALRNIHIQLNCHREDS